MCNLINNTYTYIHQPKEGKKTRWAWITTQSVTLRLGYRRMGIDEGNLLIIIVMGLEQYILTSSI